MSLFDAIPIRAVKLKGVVRRDFFRGVDAMELKEDLAVFKACSDETRLRLLFLLSERELCVCELVLILDMPQGKISRHLSTRLCCIKIMRTAIPYRSSRLCPEFDLYRIGPSQGSHPIEDSTVGSGFYLLTFQGMRQQLETEDSLITRHSCFSN